MDFLRDTLASSRVIRACTLVDESTQEAHAGSARGKRTREAHAGSARGKRTREAHAGSARGKRTREALQVAEDTSYPGGARRRRARRRDGRPRESPPADLRQRAGAIRQGGRRVLGPLIAGHVVTNAVEHEADFAKVQEWLGHANIATPRLLTIVRVDPKTVRPLRWRLEVVVPSIAPSLRLCTSGMARAGRDVALLGVALPSRSSATA
jgi:hypothetical protein